jgi:hypothetical protein
MAAVSNPTSLADVAHRTRPLVLARDQVVPVVAGLADLVPDGGLQRGSTVAVEGGPGATSLALVLAAGPSAAGGWVAVVGRDDLGLAAAVEAGIDPERLALVAEPPRDQWAAVVAALVGAVDVVLAGPQRVGTADARRLAARARERGTVLVQVVPGSGGSAQGTGGQGTGGSSQGSGRGSNRASAWGSSRGSGRGSGLEVDLRLRVVDAEWQGMGRGHGHLRARRVVVEATGRRRAARARRAELWLPDERGRIRAVAPEALRPVETFDGVGAPRSPGSLGSLGPRPGAYAGSDVDRLVDSDPLVDRRPLRRSSRLDRPDRPDRPDRRNQPELSEVPDPVQLPGAS